MEHLDIEKLIQWYDENAQRKLHGRYITVEMIAPLIKALKHPFLKEVIGFSFDHRPIYKITIGTGTTKVLLWSQMHGNESTGTKALFDLFAFLSLPKQLKEYRDALLKACTLVFIPMLNPDGAKVFTRVNAQGIDLNRDVLDLKAPESILLKKVLQDTNPRFCFNLHDQRTIFNVQGTKNPASISFLAPSEDEARTLTQGRKTTMSVIVAMNTLLQKVIPNHIGRYTDEFYPTATGDNFQKAGHHTILIEAGHYSNDYDREDVRKFNFYALLQGLYYISTTKKFNNYKSYFDIPSNQKECFDIIYRNVSYPLNEMNDIAIQFVYKVENEKLLQYKTLAKVGDLKNSFGHLEITNHHEAVCLKTLLNS